jgi:hypothetical protein
MYKLFDHDHCHGHGTAESNHENFKKNSISFGRTFRIESISEYALNPKV